MDDDPVPRLFRCHCGRRPQASYGVVSVISCQCGEEATVETPPFFQNAATQREHETWRAAARWNRDRSHHEH
ncbi:DUF1922 domain-containing protein [Rhizobium leguminosarum]|nr:DUF1922 domain-containing protein [Rhizobium leguminosarum]